MRSGAMGAEILKHLVDRSHEVVGVADSDPGKAGRTLVELTGVPLEVRVKPSVRDIQLGGVDVAVISTSSRVSQIEADALRAISNGLDVVTTSEEMAYPDYAALDAGLRIDTLAKERGVCVVGVGVNPGFVMDWVPAVVARASKDPNTITRRQERGREQKEEAASGQGRGGPDQSEVRAGAGGGVLGHVGLVEFAHLIALSLGKELEGLRQGVFPVLGSEDYVMGVRQFVEGTAGRCAIRLDLEMSLTSADFDVIEIRDGPSLKLRFEKGVSGDSATVALVVHAVERVAKAR
ncbi:MAG: hypothetical protein LYZ70_06890, partial [Nitrososphaerales archaeon]|nr:hypothetical protein [Nitrososphaerales archaeon]